MAQQLWASAVAADWQAVHEAYADTLAQQTPPQLQALNRYVVCGCWQLCRCCWSSTPAGVPRLA
jgi:hypothetical protein